MDYRESKGSIFAGVAVTLVIVFFGVLLAGYYVPAYSGVDENGYLCAARRIALTGDSAKYTAHPLEYVSENVVQTDESIFYPKYPLGYPWLSALAYRLGGPPATFLVNPLLATLAVLGMFFLGRELVGAFAGVVGAVLLATNPMHTQFALSALSHSGAICFAIWGIFFLWRWTKRGGWVNALLAGALLGYTYTVRYSEALLVLPAVGMILWRFFSLPEGATPTERIAAVKHWRYEVLAMAGGAFLAVGPLWVHHWLAFGAPWKTGYDLCGESTGFAWKWFKENWWLTLTRLNTPGLLLVFPLGLAGLAYVLAHDARRGTLLGLWLVPAVLLYTAYYWAPTGEGRGYVRFFVSVFPPLIIGALALLLETVKPRGLWSVTFGGFIAVVATFNLRESMPDLATQSERLEQVRQTWDAVAEHVPAGSILIAPGASLNNLEFVGNYELYSTDVFDRRAIQRRLKILDDNDPHPFQRRKAESLAHLVGNMTEAQLTDLQRSLLVSNVAAGRTVAVVSSEGQFRDFRGRLGAAFNYEEMTEWSQFSQPRKGFSGTTTWGVYRLEPRTKTNATGAVLTSLDEKIDELQFQLKLQRAEFYEKYPGAQEKLSDINDLQRQLREARDKANQLGRRKPVKRAGASPVTNLTTSTIQPKTVTP